MRIGSSIDVDAGNKRAYLGPWHVPRAGPGHVFTNRRGRGHVRLPGIENSARGHTASRQFLQWSVKLTGAAGIANALDALCPFLEPR